MEGREVRVRELGADDVPAAVEVLATGMRDNPVHAAVFGSDPARRTRSLRRMFTALLDTMDHAQRLCAVDDRDRVIGFLAGAAPHRCQPDPRQTARMAWAVAPLGPAALARVRTWQRAWQRADPREPHSHLGPVAVAPDLQGHGIGSGLLRSHLTWLDGAGLPSHLETDRPENVEFYRRHGFTVRAEADVLGVTTWFMGREPAR